MKDKIFAVLQRVGRSFMLPIAILPVAGLFLGIGGSFTNATMLEAYHLTGIMGEGTWLYSLFYVMSKAGDIVFANLPVIFAMGVAIGMAKKEKEVAALSSVIAFFIMHVSISALLELTGLGASLPAGSITSVLGIQSLQMGVFGGIIVGLGVSALHNKFYKIELPQVLSFFGGTRFVPIISAVTYLFVGILMFFIWPTIQEGIYAVGDIVRGSGYAGTWVYGLMERALIPFGLHHVFYIPFWQTAVGGTAMVNGTLVEGAQNIFFAQLADPNTTRFSVEATRFMSGKFPLMIFGLPGAALAMYTCAKDDKKKIVGGLLLSAALTSMLTGITEPLEFTFLFVAPLLYIIHCVFAGLAYMLMHIFNVGVGMTFSGGLIDLTLFGILQGNDKTNWIWIVIVGIVYFIVYYLVFAFLIKKMDLKTPGREDGDGEVKLYTRKDVEAKDGNTQNSQAQMIVEGLGNANNITDLDCCATRLRVTVKDSSKVNQETLKASGAAGVIVKGNGIQVIYGPKVSVIKSNIEDYLANPTAHQAAAPVVEEKAAQSLKEEIKMLAIVDGTADLITNTPDETFASKMMGDGIMFIPSAGEIFAPCDATVEFIFPTKHAIGLKHASGLEMLIHVGIDTVKLNGEGFKVLVQEGQSVKANEPILQFDLPYIQANAKDIATVMVFTNLDDNNKLEVTKLGTITHTENVLTIK
ncbi:MAG: glucose PTS transporter subunit IIA [Erysipelotrichaceae bacterium]|nr:glucose PTS transporter subunit IIA [Erysipelotrichaceae bacterium]MDY5252365.1 glucose PTS transporter subunit IIA [Erysipelotrichaceae bacterium]